MAAQVAQERVDSAAAVAPVAVAVVAPVVAAAVAGVVFPAEHSTESQRCLDLDRAQLTHIALCTPVQFVEARL